MAEACIWFALFLTLCSSQLSSGTATDRWSTGHDKTALNAKDNETAVYVVVVQAAVTVALTWTSNSFMNDAANTAANRRVSHTCGRALTISHSLAVRPRPAVNYCPHTLCLPKLTRNVRCYIGRASSHSVHIPTLSVVISVTHCVIPVLTWSQSSSC